jgi:hypothetical protein
MSHRAAYFLAVLLAVTPVLACDCRDAGPFLEVAKDAKLVVRGVVASHVDHGLILDVREIYQGREARQTIRIWGGVGGMCRNVAREFPDGTEWVFALGSVLGGDLRYKDEQVTDYEVGLDACGEYAVRVEDGYIVTRGTPERVGIETLPGIFAVKR